MDSMLIVAIFILVIIINQKLDKYMAPEEDDE